MPMTMTLKLRYIFVKISITLIIFIILFSLARSLISLIPIKDYLFLNTNHFCIFVSSIATFTAYLLLFRDKLRLALSLRRKAIIALSFLPLIAISGAIINIVSPHYKHIVIEPWHNIAPYFTIISTVIILLLVYAPAHLLNRYFLKYRWTTLEKLVFYPIISLSVLGLVNLLLSILNIHRYSTWCVILLTVSLFSIFD
ncbi:MAG: hypothetical protein DRJ49_07945, partial [Thermoprotei archaeon]